MVGETRACVIGWPIEHSRSPLIHRYWIEKYDVLGSYEKIAIPPNELEGFLNRLTEKKLAGCNVTIPFKEDVFQKVEIDDDLTEKIGAVNTIYRKGAKLYGLNTDGYGFLKNLKFGAPLWDSKGKCCLLLGAGGAARAIIAALLDDGVNSISIFNRTEERGQKLAAKFGPAVQARPLKEFATWIRKADILVNSTALGMTGQPALEISLKGLKPTCIVTDIVYDPLETTLLKTAKRQGNQIVDGLGMLLFQAVPGFEKWFGIRPEVTPQLRQIIIDDLMKDQTS